MIIGNLKSFTDLARKKALAADLLTIEIANEAENQKRVRNYKSTYQAKAVPAVYKTPSELRLDKDRLLRDAREKLVSLGLDFPIVQQVITNYLNESVDTLIKFNGLFPSIKTEFARSINPTFATAGIVIDLIKSRMNKVSAAYGSAVPTTGGFSKASEYTARYDVKDELIELSQSDFMEALIADPSVADAGKLVNLLVSLEQSLPDKSFFETIERQQPIEKMKYFDEFAALFAAQKIPDAVEISGLIDKYERDTPATAVRLLLRRFSNAEPQRISEFVARTLKEISEGDIKEAVADDGRADEAIRLGAAVEAEAIGRERGREREVAAPFDADLEEALNLVIRKQPYKSEFAKLTHEEQLLLLPLIQDPNSKDPAVEKFKLMTSGMVGLPQFEKVYGIKIEIISSIVAEARAQLGFDPDDATPFEDGDGDKLKVRLLRIELVKLYVRLQNGLRDIQDRQDRFAFVQTIIEEANSQSARIYGYRVDDYEDGVPPPRSMGVEFDDERKSFFNALSSEVAKKEGGKEEAKEEEEDAHPLMAGLPALELKAIIGQSPHIKAFFIEMIDLFEEAQQQFGKINDGSLSYEDRVAAEVGLFQRLMDTIRRKYAAVVGGNILDANDRDTYNHETERDPFLALRAYINKRLKEIFGYSLEELEEGRRAKPAAAAAPEPAAAATLAEPAAPPKKARAKKVKSEEQLAAEAATQAAETALFKKESLAKKEAAADLQREQAAVENFTLFETEFRERFDSDPQKAKETAAAIFMNISSEILGVARMPALARKLDKFFESDKQFTEPFVDDFLKAARAYFEVVNKTDRPAREAYRRTANEPEQKGKIIGSKDIAPLTYGLGVKEKEFVARRIKVGGGISPPDEPTYRQFGKYVIHMPYLHNNTANFKYPSLGAIPTIKPTPISDDYKELLLQTLTTGALNEKDLRRLEPKEIKHFEKVVSGAGLLAHFKLNKSADDEVDDLKRFELLRGEVNAGNNAPSLLKELRALVTKFMDNGRVKRKEGERFLSELK